MFTQLNCCFLNCIASLVEWLVTLSWAKEQASSARRYVRAEPFPSVRLTVSLCVMLEPCWFITLENFSHGTSSKDLR